MHLIDRVADVAAIKKWFSELDIQYSKVSTGDFPSHCLLKACKPHLFHITEKEASFYEIVAGVTSSVPLLRSYGTAVNQDLQSVAILLEDKGDKDFQATQWPVPPHVETCERAFSAFEDLGCAEFLK